MMQSFISSIKKFNIFNDSFIYCNTRLKSSIDYSLFPKLNENEIKENYVRGNGPGGQAVNKTSNCVVLKHIPTNITIKCHIHRSLSENRKEARLILLNKLDRLINGKNSVEAQKQRIIEKKTSDRLRKHIRIKDLKQKWLEREKND